ncbi:hypothetical protein LEMLEM_LOCUS9131 [Lemmus lemmus]
MYGVTVRTSDHGSNENKGTETRSKSVVVLPRQLVTGQKGVEAGGQQEKEGGYSPHREIQTPGRKQLPAFFCLSGDETNIAPPSARHTCTRSRCCVRGLDELGSHTRDGARLSPAPPAPARCPEEASAGDGGAHPARHTRAHPGGAADGSPAAQGAARRARSCSQRDRPHPPVLVLRIRLCSTLYHVAASVQPSRPGPAGLRAGGSPSLGIRETGLGRAAQGRESRDHQY